MRLVSVVAVVVALVLIALAAMPWQLLRGQIESRISARLGVPVAIGSVTRRQWFSLHPVVEMHDLRIAQPGWAGAGDLARARLLAVRFAALPILLGRLRVEGVTLEHATLRLVRHAGGRWNIDGNKQPGGSGSTPGLAGLVVRDSRLIVIEAKRHMTLDANWSANDSGVIVAGTGTHRGQPMRLSLRGAPVAAGRPWTFRITLSSPLLALRGQGRTERSLSLDRITATVEARADDARYLDDVIEAGLPGTQAITIRAHVRHDKPDWHLTDISASVGRSPFAGTLDVLKRDGRTVLNGKLRFASLDFDDLASDAGLAKAAAKRRAIGPASFRTPKSISRSCRAPTARSISRSAGSSRADPPCSTMRRPS